MIALTPCPIRKLNTAHRRTPARALRPSRNMTDVEAIEVSQPAGLPGTCAFRADTRATRIQTNSPSISRKLSNLKGGRLVAWSCSGKYLKVYEVPHSLGWAKRYLNKLAREMNTNPNSRAGQRSRFDAHLLKLSDPISPRTAILIGREGEDSGEELERPINET